MGTLVIFSKMKAVRNRKGLSQQQVADMVGIHRVTVARIESGNLPNTNIQIIGRIAKVLGVNSLGDICEVVTTEDNHEHTTD